MINKDDVGWVCPVCKKMCHSYDILCPFCVIDCMNKEKDFFRILKRFETIKESDSECQE